MNIPEQIWRAYDIRGNANEELTVEVVRQMARALVEYLKPLDVQQFAVGRDCRLSGPALQSAFVDGLRSGGMNVIDIGMVPTPLLYFAVDGFGIDAGAIITASHNPPDDNGIKLRVQDRLILPEDIQHWKALSAREWPSTRLGTLERQSLTSTYLECLSAQAIDIRGMRIGIDAGSGAMGPVAQELFEGLGAVVYPLYCTPDGRFPFHPADPTKPQNLQDLKTMVLQEKLDIGFAFDGDGDRIGVVTPQGRLLWGDYLMALAAQELLKYQTGTLIQDVKCSMMFQTLVESLGGHVVTSATGYALVQQAMREHEALFGGEQSSHLSFSDQYFGYDDGLYAAIRLLPTVTNIDKRIDDLPKTFSTPELRIPVDEKQKPVIMGALKDIITAPEILTVDGLRPADHSGWALIRPSNTEAVLTIRTEAITEADFNAWKGRLYGWLLEAGLNKTHLAGLR